MRALIERNFTFILLLGIVAGLYVPGLDHLPAYAPIIAISMVIFFSCSRVSLEEIRGFDRRAAFLFFVVRFFLVPALLYYLALQVVPDYALGILLVALMPVGVASTAMANLTGGNPSISLAATVVTNAMTPLTVPFMLWLLSGNDVPLDAGRMLITLALSVFLPASLYFLIARRIAPVKRWISRESQAATTLLLGVMAALVIALQRSYIFDYPQEVLWALAVACGLFALLYVFGWLYAFSMPAREKTTYAICSGTNNIALSAGIAALYFSATTTVFTVMGEIAWIIGVAVFKRFSEYRRHGKQHGLGTV